MGPVFWFIIGLALFQVAAWILYRVTLWLAGYRFRTEYVYDWRGRAHRRVVRYNVRDDSE